MGNRRALSDRPPSPRVCYTAGCDPLSAFPCSLRGDAHVTAGTASETTTHAPGAGSRGARRDAYWLVTVWRRASVCPPPPLAEEEKRWLASSGHGSTTMRPTKSKSWFTRFAKWTARATGRPVAFLVAVIVIVVWAGTGPVFGFSDTWQLVINTGTTIITFLMVFLIQNTQNRDAEAIQVKLDELIRAIQGAHTALLDLEELEEEELDRIRANYERLAARARTDLRQGIQDTGVPDVDEAGTD